MKTATALLFSLFIATSAHAADVALSSKALKATPIGADSVALIDSEDSNAVKRATLTSISTVVADGTGTDDQGITEFTLTGDNLTITLEDDAGGQKTVDLSGYLDSVTATDLPTTGSWDMSSMSVTFGLEAGDIPDLSGTYAAALGADDNYVTDAEKVVIGNTSGVNTGDQTAAGPLTIVATGFDGNLTTDDDTVQELAQAVDDLTVGGLTNPMTTAGDIIYGGASGTPTRLAGSASDGYVLAYNTSTGEPYWKADSTGAGGDQLVDIVTTSPLTVNATTNVNDALPGSDSDITFAIADAAADGTTKGAASFTAADFDASSGNISIDYTNGQKATNAQPGFATAAQITTLESVGSAAGVSVADVGDYFTGTDLEAVTQEIGASLGAAVEITAGTGITINAGEISVTADTYQPLDADLTTWAGVTPSTNGQSLVSAADYAAMRALLDLESGTDFNAYDANLSTNSKRYHQTAHINPDYVYDNEGYVELDPKTSAALTISEIYVRLNEDPTTELTITCYQKTAGIDHTSPTTIGSGDTTAGVLTVSSGFTDATVPSGSMMWCAVEDDPDATTVGMTIVLAGSYD